MQFSLGIITIAAAIGLSHALAMPKASAVGRSFVPAQVTAAQVTHATIAGLEATPAAVATMTVRLANNAGVDLFTKHVKGWGATADLVGKEGEGTLAKDATATFALHNGYEGTVFINRAD